MGEEKSVEVEISFGLLESMEDVREEFFSLCVSAGRQVLSKTAKRCVVRRECRTPSGEHSGAERREAR